ncbi:MAG: hypothetical protein HYS33_09160 [Acidobacteria bacterium]|nr:hypothetical protein [Acidobacteriota bacterium]
MQSDSTIQDLWLRMLSETRRTGETKVEKVEDGYYLVARPAGENRDAGSTSAFEDYSALASRIPNLCRTRAVYLNLGDTYDLREIEKPREWLGVAADRLESGALRAFAVVDTEIFSRRIAWELLTRGWAVEEVGDDLEVRDGRFIARFNLLRAVVRMVLSRANMAQAAGTIVRELGVEFDHDAGFFVRFHKRFETYQPDVLDHYFVVHPETSCVALGWDYRQLAGRSGGEAERIFGAGVAEVEKLLQTPVGAWLPGVSPALCALNLYEN